MSVCMYINIYIYKDSLAVNMKCTNFDFEYSIIKQNLKKYIK